MYESSVAFGMRKALQAEQGKTEMEQKVLSLSLPLPLYIYYIYNIYTYIIYICTIYVHVWELLNFFSFEIREIIVVLAAFVIGMPLLWFPTDPHCTDCRAAGG